MPAVEVVMYSVTYWVAINKRQAHHILFSDLNKAEEWASAMRSSEFYIVGEINEVTTTAEEVA